MADLTTSADVDTFMGSANAAAMRSNLGLGTAATTASSDYANSEHASTHLTGGPDAIQPATASQPGLATAAQITKLDGIETGADVTDTANVTAAGAVMPSGVASSTDNALVRYDSTTGKVVQNGQITESDTGDLASVNSITMDTTPTGTIATEGQIMWNSDEETLDIQLSSFAHQVGQQILYHVQNNTANTIAKGVPVMFAGTTGNSGKLLIQPWDGVGPATLFLGLTSEAIISGSQGFVVAFGKLRGIQTNGGNYSQTWVDGDIIYAGTTTGSLTKTQPTAPNPIVQALAVVHAHASNGTYFVRTTYILGNALTSNTLEQFAATTSAQLRNVISDETGSGALVFAESPTLVTPALGTPVSGNLVNCTGFPGAPLFVSKTDTETLNSTTWSDISGLSLSFTAASITQKISVRACLNAGNPTTAVIGFRLVNEDGVLLQAAPPVGSRLQCHASTYASAATITVPVTFEVVYTPGTTSARTYKVQWSRQGSSAVYINRSSTDTDGATLARTASTLFLQPY